MWSNAELKDHLDNSSVVRSASAVHMEWNLNDPANIDRVGNYRHRPGTTGQSRIPLGVYDPNDSLGEYTGATVADIVIEGDLDNNNEPSIFTTPDQDMGNLFSLDDCFQPNRPRSGINKLLMLPGKRWLLPNNYVDKHPRYYVSSKTDPFKYWTSFRNISPESEPNASLRYPDGIPASMSVGISKKTSTGKFVIEDACPFVVYKTTIHANRLTIKMQTHTSDVEGPHVSVNGVDIGDPTYGYYNQQTPSEWKVQVLKNNMWSDAFVALPTTVRSDGTALIQPDGHVELEYGLRIPTNYRYIGSFDSADKLPTAPMDYDAYLVADGNSAGLLYLYLGGWRIESAIYDWHVLESNETALPIDSIAQMDTYYNGMELAYRNVDKIQGVRVVVTYMNTPDSTFDLIEISPRLVVDITDMVASYSVKSALASMDATDLPVGYLLPGTGSVSLIDTDSIFSDPNNIFAGLSDLNTKFVFYEGADGVNGMRYLVPLKTMYSEGLPPNTSNPPEISFELRDGFWLLEKMKAPSIFMRDVSLSVAIATLLDYIGFSNYTFKRDGDKEFTIPFFYVSNDKTVAEVLQDLARAAQAGIFFDEYNNLVVMYKEYMLTPSRDADIVLDGNGATPHIINIASDETKRYNDGRLDYTERYIQRSVSSLRQANFVNEDQTLIYKPVLLWEASGSELTRANNEMGQTQSAFSLGACVLNSSLTADVPSVRSGAVINNVIDVGESVYWLPRYNGYFYANGEIIKFDAVEYAITGRSNEWVSSNSEYQKYYADVPFNGKIYPTGRVRIYTEPQIATNELGESVIVGVTKHGRGQFQTQIAAHEAGLSADWQSLSNKMLIEQDSDYLFQTKDLPATVYVAQSGTGRTGSAGGINVNGIVKNHFRDVQYGEGEVGTFVTARAGTVQSSALVLQGPKDYAKKDVNFISLVKKQLPSRYTHYGTRCRVIGEVKPVGEVEQTATGESTYYSDVYGIGNVLTGGSGGIAIDVDPSKNTGYFLEIIALSNSTIAQAAAGSSTEAHNVVFYKNMAPEANNGVAKSIPVKMWGGRANIVVDSGEFIGQSRMATEDFPSVFDIAIESKTIGGARRFFLYIDGHQVGVVDDPSPLPTTSTYGLFSRGTSKMMFENTYAILDNSNTSTLVAESVATAFGDTQVTTFEAMNKYAISGIVQKAYLNGINTDTSPQKQMFYDEFGTILRECAYFNIKFDKAFPALKARISPTFNGVQTYFISGFTHNAYGAEFLIFNATDKALNLDETTGNYLRIQGVAFTQSNQRTITMDDLYNEIGSSSDVFTSTMQLAQSPIDAQRSFRDVKIDRRKRGKNEFSISTEYIQRQDDALELMTWLSTELTKPRKLVGVEVFPYPIVQLGDIVTIDYTDSNGIEPFSQKRFVVYNIEYERSEEELSQKLYLAETS